MSQIYTIGFTKKSLKQFIHLLKQAGVTILIDTRLNNTSQLSGFAKKNDLQYILELVNIGYYHDISLAPTQDILSEYKNKLISWEEYENRYLDLISKRKIERRFEKIAGKDVVCFLCSEDKPHHCHRSILANYLKEHMSKKVDIVHLV